jgi:hypothetical protein
MYINLPTSSPLVITNLAVCALHVPVTCVVEISLFFLSLHLVFKPLAAVLELHPCAAGGLGSELCFRLLVYLDTWLGIMDA